ncbi:MAG: 5'-methylthioadenosine/adenosylhomocysteine nucleosidase [Ruminococcaceae bacterium]|nr:5'-methylthioadenosine/adenosylhomocysteine nucleosidase [Oscillospiraceae bacterium]
MKIGIIGAMKCETDALKAMLEAPISETVSGVEYVSGKLFGSDVIIATCGIGKVFAAVCAQTMILRYAPDIIINTGVAGTLTGELSVCDIAVSESVVQHDMDTSAIGDPVGLISGINIVNIPADEKLCSAVCDAASELGFKALKGTIASGDVFVADPHKKEYIRSMFGAAACEMEGASIGQVCYVNSVPFVVIRAISDGGDDDAAMSYDRFVTIAAENSVKLVCRVIKKQSL